MKETYTYTTGALGTLQSRLHYDYGNSNWKDQLTSYNGTTITYDLSGNPLNWRNASAMNWTGRQLDSMTLMNGTTLSFLYNSDGLRVSKTVGNNTVKYRWDGTTLLAEEHTNYTLTFLYDGDTLIGFNYGDNNYYYGIDNLGVIHYVYNEAGTVVVTYTYDAWGNTVSADGDDTIINVNPIRYKSYYYDSEAEYYYLVSRYYDPSVCRFINSDGMMGVNDDIYTYNLNVYCGNIPTNRCDEYGFLGKELWDGAKKVVKHVIHKGHDMAVAVGLDTAKIGAYFLQMEKDNRGVYHATFDCWQQYLGYNDIYDFMFDIGTDMKAAKFPFKYNGKYITIWAWKGDYINLGAGAELGIYRGDGNICYVDKKLSMFMTLTLKYKDKSIIYYTATTWWITGFNPKYQNVKSKHLQVTFKIYFMSNEGLYRAFRNTWKSKDKRWTFNDSNKSAQFTF